MFKQAVLITNTVEQESDRLVERIRNRIEQINSKGEDPRLSLSMGCAHLADGEAKNLQNVFKKADDLMYKDKRNRKAVPT
ncbi:MAG: diguanylate cyclase [Desulfobacteraceae bacterium]|nr:diguanylate cyclase [Desulfobacteraceae bacterium]